MGDYQVEKDDVAPFTGAWIEILEMMNLLKQLQVAPFTGAWIEIQKNLNYFSLSYCRSLHGGVD